MATAVTMPKFGQTMTEGTVVSWERKVGDSVRTGDVLLKIETDKAEMDVEAEASGDLLRIDVGPGATVPCGTVIAWIGTKGERI
jgi:pyruvate/2-oxoglutarate dehydrogenase complex dihydrolipoamide acyltransferase (E2) component